MLGVQVIAQGIETHEQIGALVRMGCLAGQGAMLSLPLNAAQAFALAEMRSAPTAPRK